MVRPEFSDLRHSLLSVFGLGTTTRNSVKILDDVSLDIAGGSRVWLSGDNGAGKTTLLRLLAGIYAPSSGSIKHDGSINCLLDVSLGMNLDCSGIQNIYLLGATRNMSIAEIESNLEWVIEFSELGDQINDPLRTYSTGMKMRLACAVSLVGAYDSYLLDEFFGALDSYFSTKAFNQLRKVMKPQSTMFFATHSGELARKICTHELQLVNGKIERFGKII